MRYMMKSGILSVLESGKVLAKIKRDFLGTKKTVLLSSSGKQYQADISITNISEGTSGDIRFQTYVLKNSDDEVLMNACPGYAKEDDPDVVDWPICRAPKVDHAVILFNGITYLLVMHNSQNYSLQDQNGVAVLQIMHRGISGGWTIDTTEKFPPQVLCGLFIFCRYIEQENEFIVV